MISNKGHLIHAGYPKHFAPKLYSIANAGQLIPV